MRNLYLLFSIISLSFNVFATKYNEEFDQIIKKYPRANIAIYAKNKKTNQEIFAFNEKKLMIPASTLKTFTAYGALEILKSDFTYQTKIFIDKENNLYFKFSGDPSFTLENFNQLISKLPVKKFNHIFIDDFAFDDQYISNGAAQEDKKFCFSAPSSAIVINQNCFRGFLEPAAKLGNKARLYFTEDIFAKIDNQIITKNDPSCKPHLKAYENNHYLLHGCIDHNAPKITLNIAYQDPRLLIKEVIRQSKIKFSKEIMFKKIAKTEAFVAHQSSPLGELIKIMLKDSNNLYADNIFKTIGTNFYSGPGGYFSAAEVYYKFLEERFNISPENSRIVDGSGASRYNLLAADQLVDLMTLASSDQIFIDALPVANIDGTLKDRYKNILDNHSIIAKTGSLGNVLCLAGYINKEIVFAIMINGITLSRSDAIELEEQIISFLIQKSSI